MPATVLRALSCLLIIVAREARFDEMMRFLLVPILVIIVLAASGCAAWIGRQIATAPGPANTNYVVGPEVRRRFSSAYGFGQLEIPVGPPDATLAVTIIHPGDYGLEYDFRGYENDTVNLDFDLNDPDSVGTSRREAKGTVIVLPGMLQSRYTMTFWGIGLAERGYRVVLVDLRGHGESSGRYLTYGLVESRDTLQVIEALDEWGIAKPPIALLGVSYGASTALMTAARSDAIGAVVAFAPFTDAASSIEHLMRTLFPFLSRAVSAGTMAKAIDRASTLSGADIRQARAIDVVDRIQVPVLFVHGREDNWIPPRNSLAFYDAANRAAYLMVIPGAGHMDLPMRYEEFSDRVFDWLDDAVSAPASVPTVTAASGGVKE